ncbi:MAG: hypothetical protein AAF515_03285 [Pseudomonadota bacterium]
MSRVIFVIGGAHEQISTSDELVAAQLRAAGVRVDGVPWTREPDAFADADLIVLRSNWDYPYHLERFEAWLAHAENGAWPLVNAAPLVRWNLRKSYLFELEAAGVPVPRTTVAASAAQVEATLRDWGTANGVIKPLCGASGVGVRRVERGQPTVELDGGDWLLQELMPEIRDGEWSLAFFGGEFSHAVRKTPQAGEFRINSRFGGAVETQQPTPNLIGQAGQVLDALSKIVEYEPLYARIDGIVKNNQFILFELELNEPSFYLQHEPAGAERFAKTLLETL